MNRETSTRSCLFRKYVHYWSTPLNETVHHKHTLTKCTLKCSRVCTVHVYALMVIMRPSSLGGAAYCVALCLSVCLSVRPVIVAIGNVFSSTATSVTDVLFGTALMAAYRTAISAAQILVYSEFSPSPKCDCVNL